MAVRRWKPNKIRCRTTLDVVEIGHDMDMGMNMDMEHGVGMWVRCERASVPQVCMSAAIHTRPRRMDTSASPWRGAVLCGAVQRSAVQCSAVLCCAVQCCVQCACCSAVRVCDAVRVCAQRQRAACEGTSLSRWWCGGASPASGLLRHVTQSLVVQCNAMQCSGCAWCSAMQAGRCVVRARVCACLLVRRRVRVRRGRRG